LLPSRPQSRGLRTTLTIKIRRPKDISVGIRAGVELLIAPSIEDGEVRGRDVSLDHTFAVDPHLEPLVFANASVARVVLRVGVQATALIPPVGL
ncbi:hypothetical protein, partial [Bradyrhizobium japonicum]|uniref:hypothetical protein n=1 Tax=Bradyrhizobium japonicum TaxID=375 RepID=UPI001AEC5E3A